MSENLRKVIQKQELFLKTDKLLIGVSGGMDSMALCNLLYNEGYSIGIAHCNYHLRGTKSERDQDLVSSWANERNIPCFIKSIAITDKSNIQEKARILRYSFFDELKLNHHYSFILTAHHEDDQIETFFINLSRGAGLKGLKGMNTRSGDLIRPFLKVSRKQIEEYVIENGILYREDLSNKTDVYLRNFFRNEILPSIHSRLPEFNELCARSISHLSKASELIENIYNDWKSSHCLENKTELKIVKPLIGQIYLLDKLLSEMGFHPETILRIHENYDYPGKTFTDKNHHELLVDREFIFIRNIENNKSGDTHVIQNTEGEIINSSFKLYWHSYPIKALHDSFTLNNAKVFIDQSKIRLPLYFRPWLTGDAIKPFGMNGKSKKIQDVFTDRKISIFDKEKIYLLANDEEVLWIPGLIRSEIARINENTEDVIEFNYTIV